MLLASLLMLLVASSTAPADALSPPAAGLGADHSFTKRSLFDPSCTGVFDRQLLRRLSRVCDDCFNVFREPNVATECRSVTIYGFPYFTFPVSIPFVQYRFHYMWHERLSKASTIKTNCLFSRSNCYNNEVFRQCMEYLLPAHLHEEHRLAVQMVGK